MNIVVSYQVKWGKELFYPTSVDAVFLTRFTGKPTLSKRQLKLARENGWKVRVEEKKLNLDEYLNEKSSKEKD